MIARDEVYRAIDSERNYQKSLPPNRTDGREHTVGDFVLLLEEYADKARKAWVNNAGDAKCLEEIRKCAGIAVSCMEHHGAPFRQW